MSNVRKVIRNDQRVSITCPVCERKFIGRFGDRRDWKTTHQAHSQGQIFVIDILPEPEDPGPDEDELVSGIQEEDIPLY